MPLALIKEGRRIDLPISDYSKIRNQKIRVAIKGTGIVRIFISFFNIPCSS